MEKIIYHGSDHIIEKPKYGYGKTYNDYGVGFYCTENPDMAKEWGVGIGTETRPRLLREAAVGNIAQWGKP